MASYWFGRAAGSWTVRLALALTAIALLVGLLAAHQRSADAARRSLAREGGGSQPAIEWSGPRGQARTLEIRLDDAVLNAVREVQQAVVNEIKAGRADGRLTPD